MRIQSLLSGLASAVLIFTALAAAHADVASDYAALTAGISTVPGSGGTPGTVVLHGRTAFPVFTENTNGTSPVVAAGHWNDNTNSGRGLAYAHTGWTSTTGDMGLAMSNALRWAARAKPNAVIARGASVSTTFINSLGYTVKTVDTSMNNSSTDLSGVDVFLMNGQSDYTSNAVFKITNFVATGGGVLVFETPWAASSAALADANAVLCGVGLTFSGDYNSGGPFAVSPQPYPAYVSALTGLDLLLAHRAGTTNLPLAVQQAAADSIDGVLAVRPLFPPLTNGLQTLLNSYGGVIRINAGRTLAKASAPIEALCERYHSGAIDLTPAALIMKHPDADDWPGAVVSGAPVISKTVFVQGDAPPDDPALINQGSHGSRQPVGLYAPAGTVVRVRIPADKVNAGLRIQIGHHHDENFHLSSWHRHPKVARYEPLTNVINEVASPYGGLILVRVPPDARLGRFPITLSGAVEAPHFEQGVDSPADWARLKALPGAQGYIRSTNFTAYVSRTALQDVTDPTRVADHWGNVVATSDHLMGYLFRFREEAGKTDRDIIAGGGHAGYPFVMAYGDDDELVNGVLGDGDWGYYHELGHTYQDNGHGWNGTAGGEVDVNLIPNLLMTLVHQRSLWDNNTHSTMDANNRASARAAFFTTPVASRVWSDISGGDTAAYDFFFNLPESFGYDLWRRAFSRFYRWSTNNASEPSFAGLNNFNRWFVAMCEESGHNLTPYFENYGWPVDAATKARFTALPAWSENRPPTALNLPAPLTLGESTAPGTLVASFTTTDPDPRNLFLYSILSGNEDGAFTLDRWSGELRIASLDYERRGSYVLTITVFDNALPRYFRTNTLAISVTNVAEPPRLNVPLLRVVASSPAGTLLGSMNAQAEPGRIIASFAHVGGSALFAIHPTSGAVTLAQTAPPLNGGVFTFTVRVTDSAGAFSEAEVPVMFNSLPGLREQRWNGATADGVAAFDGFTNAWPSANLGDNYVRRLTAWLVPPQTGAYTFWVTGSDRATLYLDTNASPSGRVALCTGASTGVGNFDADPGQRSAPVLLEAGQSYYLGVFQTEGTGTDYAQAAWQGPAAPTRILIPPTVLIPGSDVFFPPGAGTGPVTGVNLRIGPTDPGGPLTFTAPFGATVDAVLSGDPTAVTNVQFYVDGVLHLSDNAPTFFTFWSGTPGYYTLHAVARDRHGNVVTSPLRVVTLVQGIVTNTLVASSALWRYFDQGQDLGTAWRDAAFNDSSWSSGAARLGFGGDGEVTTLNGGPSNARFPTTYFRRTVNVTNLARHAGFTLAVARDDGAVVYVNGAEVFRTGMNAGAVNYSTLALNATEEQAFYPTNLPASAFVEGTNTLAVEVHQTSASSGDLGFAIKLEGAFTTPAFSVAITDPAPGGSVVLPGGPILGGWPVTAQAATPAGSITNVTLRVNGTDEINVYGSNLLFYFRPPGTYTLDAVARNSLGQSVTSAPVSVTVISNAAPRVQITFPSFFQNLPQTNTFFLTASASDDDGEVTSVELFLDNVSLGALNCPPYTWLWEPVMGPHSLFARVRDDTGGVGSSGPVNFTVTAPPIVTNLTLIASNASWRYHDGGLDLGTNWRSIFYHDGSWSNGVAKLGFGGDGEATTLRGQPTVTYYFRRSFTVPAGFTATNLLLRVIRDDGVVVYFNGNEIARDNMPAGAVTYATLPLAGITGSDETAWRSFPLNPVLLGPPPSQDAFGLIAAEVHQIDGSSSDLGFNLELTAAGVMPAPVIPPPRLNIEWLAADQVRVWFADVNGRSHVVEGSTDLWLWQPLATNTVAAGLFQFTTQTTNPPAHFFRVRRLP